MNTTTTNVWYGEETVNDKDYCIQIHEPECDIQNHYADKGVLEDTIALYGELPTYTIAVFRKKHYAK